MKKRILAGLMTLVMVFSLFPTSALAWGENNWAQQYNVTVGDTRTLTGASLKDYDSYYYYNPTITWKSSNTSVVTVTPSADQSQATVKAVGTGTATVTQTVSYWYWDRWSWDWRYAAKTQTWVFIVTDSNSGSGSGSTTVADKYQRNIKWNQVESTNGTQGQNEVKSTDSAYGKVTVKLNKDGASNISAKASTATSWADATTYGFVITAAPGYIITGVSMRCDDSAGANCSTFKNHQAGMTDAYSVDTVTLSGESVAQLWQKHLYTSRFGTTNPSGDNTGRSDSGSPIWLCISVEFQGYSLSYEFQGDIPTGYTHPAGVSNKKTNDTVALASSITVGSNPVTLANGTVYTVDNTAYRFNGWYQKGDNDQIGTEVKAPGSNITFESSDIVMVGIWSKGHTVTYDANYEGASPKTYVEKDTDGTTDKTYYASDEVTVLGNNTVGFTRSGYTFKGWSTTSNNSGIQDQEYKANDTFTMPSADVTLYAIWEKTPEAKLSITKEVVDPKAEYKVGDDITYKITVTNSGDAAATNVTVKDTLPSQLEFKSVRDVSGVTFDDKTLTWTIANIPAKSGETNGVVELFITVKAVEAGTNVKNTATIGDNGPSGSDDGVTIKATYSVTYQFTGDAPSGVTAPSDTNQYAAGETVGVKQLTQTTIQTLTGTWTFNGWTSAADSDGGNVAISSGTITMPEGNVTITGTWTFKATPTLKPETHLHYDANGGYFGTTATIVKQEDKLTNGPHTLNTTEAFIPTHAQQNGYNVLFLGWTTTDTNDKVYERGDMLPNLVTSVTIPTVKAVYAVWGLDAEGSENGGDSIPDVYQAKVTYKIVNGYWSETDNADKVEYVDLYELKDGTWTAISNPTLNDVPDVTGVVAKTGYTTTGASWDTPPVNNTTLAKNNAVYTYTLPGTSILSITKTADTQTVKVGETITYTITVKNTGAAATTAPVVVTDQLDPSLEYISETSPEGVTFNAVDHVWTIPAGIAATNGTVKLTLTAKVKAGTAIGTEIKNTAYIGDKEQQDTVTVTVTDSALTITKTTNKQTVVAGETIDYTIEVTNSGNKSATVTITDVLPAELNYVSAYLLASPNVSATYDEATRTVTWANVFVPAKSGDEDGLAQMVLSVTVANDVAVGAAIKNVATSSDPNVPNSNESTVTVAANLTIQKKLASNAPDAAKTYDYKFDVKNADGTVAKTVTITGEGTAKLSLPVDSYTVTEQTVSIPNYTCTASYETANQELLDGVNPANSNRVSVSEATVAALTVTNSFTYISNGPSTTYYYFAIQKVDAQDNHALKGAKFGLYLGSSKLTTATSGKDGYVSFQIDSGDYARIKKSNDKLYYQELTAPEGYVKDNGTYTISYKDFTTTSAKAKEAAKEVLNYRTSTPDLLNDSDHYAYVQGYKDGTVRPNGLISRAETTTIFFRLLTAEVRDGNLKDRNDYTDVSDQYWANTAISTMSDLGIIQGYSNGTFNPTAPITRAQFAAICARFDTKQTSNEPTDFTDTAGHWAEGYIQRAVELGWIKGFNDGSFRPDAYITRAQAMTLINRVLNRIPEDEDDLLSGMTTWPDCKPDAWCYLAVQEATNSHDFKHKSGNYETWTGLNTAPDWSRYEN